MGKLTRVPFQLSSLFLAGLKVREGFAAQPIVHFEQRSRGFSAQYVVFHSNTFPDVLRELVLLSERNTAVGRPSKSCVFSCDQPSLSIADLNQQTSCQRFARSKCMILPRKPYKPKTAGCFEPDMFSAAVSFWTRIMRQTLEGENRLAFYPAVMLASAHPASFAAGDARARWPDPAPRTA
ncbi:MULTISPECIES: hypothetical protein [Mesorhizobium]|nr:MULTISPECIES: hypothetical protein [Mesorhizobium]